MSESSFSSDFRELLSKHGIDHPKFAYGLEPFNPNKPKVLYAGPMYDTDELVVATSALVEGKWFVAGEHVQKFEREFSKYLGQTDSVMVNSGSSADLILIAAAKARFGWPDGSGVIVSPVAFPTTISALTLNNLVPVFVDIEFDTLNFDLSYIEGVLSVHDIYGVSIGKSKIPGFIKAIFISPVLGNPPNMDLLVEKSERYGVKLLGDHCDSLGSTWRGKHLANYVVASTCSFFPSHHVAVGQAGMISSNDPEILSLSLAMNSWSKGCLCTGAGNLLPNGCCGKRFSNWLPLLPDTIVDHRYVFITDKAYNLRPIDMLGALGCVQMKKIEKIHENRRIAYDRIVKAILTLKDVKTAKKLEHSDPSWFGVSIICPNYVYKRSLLDHFEKAGIQTREYFAGNLLLQPGYSHLGQASDYPNSNEVLQRIFFIGCPPFYSEAHFDHIEKTVKSFIPPSI